MNTKHTPGPWTVLPARKLANIKGPNGEQICQLPLEHLSQGVHKAINADLIAAAPEMLEALEYIVKEVSNVPGTGKQDGSIGHRHINKAVDAIKKARGEPQ